MNWFFLAKIGFISQCTLLLGWYNKSPTICQLFYAFQIIRFVKLSKIPFWFPFNLFIRLKTPTTDISWSLGKHNSRWRPGLENKVNAEAIRNPIYVFLPVQYPIFYRTSAGKSSFRTQNDTDSANFRYTANKTFRSYAFLLIIFNITH